MTIERETRRKTEGAESEREGYRKDARERGGSLIALVLLPP